MSCFGAVFVWIEWVVVQMKRPERVMSFEKVVQVPSYMALLASEAEKMAMAAERLVEVVTESSSGILT